MRRLLLLFVPFVFSGCALLNQLLAQSLTEPRLTLGVATASDVSFDGATLALPYTLENPGALPAEVEGGEVSLHVEGVRVGPGARFEHLQVPGGGRSEGTLRVHVPFPELGPALPGLLQAGVAKYRAQGFVSLQTGMGSTRVPVEGQGTFELPKAPEAVFGAPRLAALSLASVTIELPIEVVNKNAFALPVALSGALSVAGRQVASAPRGDPLMLGGHQTSTLTLPLTFRPVELAAAALPEAGAAPVSFEGALDSGGLSFPLRWSASLPYAKLSFGGASLKDISLDGATVELVFKAENPTGAAIDLGDLRYAFYVNDHQVAAAAPPAGLRISPKAQSELRIPARIQFASLVSLFANPEPQRPARLRLEGATSLPTPLGLLPLAIRHETEFEPPALPRVTFRPPRLRSVSLVGATIELPIEVTNPNAFRLPAIKVGGSISVAGIDIGSVSTGNLGALAGHESKAATVSVTFQFLRAAAAAAAIRSGTAPLAFEGAVESGGFTLPVRWAETVRFGQ